MDFFINFLGLVRLDLQKFLRDLFCFEVIRNVMVKYRIFLRFLVFFFPGIKHDRLVFHLHH